MPKIDFNSINEHGDLVPDGVYVCAIEKVITGRPRTGTRCGACASGSRRTSSPASGSSTGRQKRTRQDTAGQSATGG
jgi:hypothetical protein